jgi:hypothetical protein
MPSNFTILHLITPVITDELQMMMLPITQPMFPIFVLLSLSLIKILSPATLFQQPSFYALYLDVKTASNPYKTAREIKNLYILISMCW